jgi:hypothetical protein
MCAFKLLTLVRSPFSGREAEKRKPKAARQRRNPKESLIFFCDSLKQLAISIRI